MVFGLIVTFTVSLLWNTVAHVALWRQLPPVGAYIVGTLAILSGLLAADVTGLDAPYLLVGGVAAAGAGLPPVVGRFVRARWTAQRGVRRDMAALAEGDE